MGLLFPKVADESRRVRLGEINEQFFGNRIDTAKYNLITFLPKSILLQFLRLSNVVFLVNAVLQSIPIISSISPITAIGPLGFVLAVSLLREGYEDYKRHRKDWEINSRVTRVLRAGEFHETEWDQVRPGDYVKVRCGEIIPADLLLLFSSEENSLCYVETATLDGENNLKEKYALTEPIRAYPHEFESLRGSCLVNAPCSNLYDFEGELVLEGVEAVELQYSQLVLRETVLKNTDEVVGVALYCGYDSKILRNQGQVHHKVSQVEGKVNYIQIVLVAILLTMCVISSIGYSAIHRAYGLRAAASYVPRPAMNIHAESTLIFFTIFLMLNFLIPITLNIVIEGVKTFSGLFLTYDRKLYDSIIKKECNVLNTSIIEELGVVDCVLTDKTGTLTANEMVFRKVALGNAVLLRDQLENDLDRFRREAGFEEFWLAVTVCHDVVRDQTKDQFQGSSPDEVCFINFADAIGYSFVKKTKNFIQLRLQEEKVVLELLDVIPFSPRRRMSVLVRDTARPEEVILFTKGADSAIFDQAHPYAFPRFGEHLNGFAKEGLRTLVFSRRVVSRGVFQKWEERRAAARAQYRQKMITKEELAGHEEELVEEMESHLTVLGATGIEDRLQEGVPETIARLQRAGIKVMMVTGDKLETAENIGYLAQLIREDFSVFRLSAEVLDLRDRVQRIASEVEGRRREVAVIIEGRQISKMLEETDPAAIANFCKILQRASSVIFCRSSPKEKALIVKFVKKHLGAVVLGIGDGGNDVGMIEEAQIGVGIMGKEGNSAAVVSDFSFGQFRFLDRLVLHHGRWFYYRLSYFFIFFGWKNVIITFIIFYFLTESAFSGTFNYTEPCYLLYNSFFGIVLLVYFGLFEQDANDDHEPALWKHLPEIYAQTKRKELFSYRRYFTWFGIGILLSLFIYFVLRLSVGADTAVDAEGRVEDLSGFKLLHGLALVIVIVLINYLDVRTRTYFLEVLIFLVCTVAGTAAFYIAENYLEVMGYMGVYGDNLNLRFWLTVFLVVSAVYLVKVASEFYFIEESPSILDRYAIARDENVTDIDAFLSNAVYEAKERRPEEATQSSKVSELKENELIYRKERESELYYKKESYSTFESNTKKLLQPRHSHHSHHSHHMEDTGLQRMMEETGIHPDHPDAHEEASVFKESAMRESVFRENGAREREETGFSHMLTTGLQEVELGSHEVRSREVKSRDMHAEIIDLEEVSNYDDC